MRDIPDLDMQFGALSDPVRRDILHVVWTREVPAGEIAKRFDISRPAVSRHLGVLRRARLVKVRENGTHRLYKADHEAFFGLRMEFDKFWETAHAPR